LTDVPYLEREEQRARNGAMVWLAAFEEVLRAAAGRSSSDDPVADAEALSAIWPGGVTIDDPIAGRVEGVDAIRAFQAIDAGWLRERGAASRLVATTFSAVRYVGEYDVELMQDGASFVLPVAVAAEPDRHRHALAIQGLSQSMAAPGTARASSATPAPRPIREGVGHRRGVPGGPGCR
jgi:hypothetical protein